MPSCKIITVQLKAIFIVMEGKGSAFPFALFSPVLDICANRALYYVAFCSRFLVVQHLQDSSTPWHASCLNTFPIGVCAPVCRAPVNRLLSSFGSEGNGAEQTVVSRRVQTSAGHVLILIEKSCWATWNSEELPNCSYSNSTILYSNY